MYIEDRLFSENTEEVLYSVTMTESEYTLYSEFQKEMSSKKIDDEDLKDIAKGSAASIGLAGAGYGGFKLHGHVKDKKINGRWLRGLKGGAAIGASAGALGGLTQGTIESGVASTLGHKKAANSIAVLRTADGALRGGYKGGILGGGLGAISEVVSKIENKATTNKRAKLAAAAGLGLGAAGTAAHMYKKKKSKKNKD